MGRCRYTRRGDDGVDGGSGGGIVVRVSDGEAGGGELSARDEVCGGFGRGTGSGDSLLRELWNGDGPGGDPAGVADSGCIGVSAEELGCEVVCGRGSGDGGAGRLDR